MCLAIPPSNRTRQYALLSTSTLLDGATSYGQENASIAAAAKNVGQSFRSTSSIQLPSLSPITSYSDAANVKPSSCVGGPSMALSLRNPTQAIAAAAAASRKNATSGAANKHARRRRAPQRPGKTAGDKQRIFVQHNYHDLSTEPDIPLEGSHRNGFGNLNYESFPIKLHRILEETAERGEGHIISWQPHGRAFKIHDPTQFTAKIMSRYFPKMKKLTSLQRQFNLYGFERLTREGPDAGAYYHEAFLRHRPVLSARRMIRKRVKGTGYKASSNPEAEPHLYALPFMEDETARNAKESNVQCHPSACFGTNDVLSSTGFQTQINANGSINLQNQMSTMQDYGIVTDSAESSARVSFSSNSEESICSERNAMEQWLFSNNNVVGLAPATPPAPTSMCLPQVAELCNPTPTVAPTNSNSIVSIPSMDEFLALPEEKQDMFLRDFFLAHDVTPLLPLGVESNNVSTDREQQKIVQQEPRQEDHPILQEFADLWENAPTHLK
eukprot:CAMPEP_0183775386 /NCGR_PEP_ID=MMETSP0739-20130205/44357_1 /TAXON_ID=385413 /ORGANISM="Thalassiosira miniscula, Strain CCMP1093" /LENGTH=497 /DNA_ID=CAMNT_0026016965 /DNA_START=20 /DNA_END=1513 /DNA_ORIENTATION=-